MTQPGRENNLCCCLVGFQQRMGQSSKDIGLRAVSQIWQMFSLQSLWMRLLDWGRGTAASEWSMDRLPSTSFLWTRFNLRSNHVWRHANIDNQQTTKSFQLISVICCLWSTKLIWFCNLFSLLLPINYSNCKYLRRYFVMNRLIGFWIIAIFSIRITNIIEYSLGVGG